MKKQLLTLGLAVMSLTSMAQTSPYTGVNILADDFTSGTYYLYNVESGKFLGSNNLDNNYWTTHAQASARGLDCIVTKTGDGIFRLDPQFGSTSNGIRADLWLDTNSSDVWTATAVSGSTNGFTLENGANIISVGEDGYISTQNDAQATWQFVTKAERLQVALAAGATVDNPIDLSWMIPGGDFVGNDNRNGWWTKVTDHGTISLSGDGDAVSGWSGDAGYVRCNAVKEFWNLATVNMHQTLSGMPNGTYGLSVQGFYRDGSSEPRGDNGANSSYSGIDHYKAGTNVNNAVYYINGNSNPLKSIYSEAKTTMAEGTFEYNAQSVGEDGTWSESGNFVPNNTNSASSAIFGGAYQNDVIKASVADGNIMIGVKKDAAVNDNWIIVDNFKLLYYGTAIDLTEVLNALNKAIADAEANTTTSTDALNSALATALAAAKTATTSTDATTIAAATTALNTALSNVTSTAADVATLKATVKLSTAEGVTNETTINGTTAMENANTVLATGTTSDDINNALSALRIARKIKNAEKSANQFTGNAPAAGDFYLYNVGQKRWLCGGADWGAHAALGFPGISVTLAASGEGYIIDTHLNNGGTSEYLNYGGYCDTPNQDVWKFVPVADANGVYNIARTDVNTDGSLILLGYRPNTYATIDTDMSGTADPNNQWILVTLADRNALLETATQANPVDASYLIKMPNFSQREYNTKDADTWNTLAWTTVVNSSIWGRGDNYPDFCLESWNQTSSDVSQYVDVPAEGYYAFTLQGYYRDGNREVHANTIVAGNTPNNNSLVNFYGSGTSEASTKLPLISDEANKAPGYGWVSAVGEYPDACTQACDFFENGLYKTSPANGLIQNTGDGQVGIEILREGDTVQASDWLVIDNVRLMYYGTEKPDLTAIKGVTDTTTAKAGKIYNLQGVQVKSASQRGIYIQNGKKFVVK
jgi:hypothetical protein